MLASCLIIHFTLFGLSGCILLLDFAFFGVFVDLITIALLILLVSCHIGCLLTVFLSKFAFLVFFAHVIPT